MGTVGRSEAGSDGMGIENQIKATPQAGDARTARSHSSQTPSAPLPPASIVISAPLPPRKAAKRAVEPDEPNLHRVEVQSLRHDPDTIRRAFETGDYPYKSKVTEAHYIERMLPLQAELLKAQNWVKETGEKIIVLRRRRQGRHDQALHGAPQSARRAHRRSRKAERARAHAMVFSALHPPPAGRGRNGVLRPLLVQSRGSRARDGLLQAQRIPRVHAPVPRDRAHARALRDPAVQILVLRDARGAAPPLCRTRRRPLEAV